MARVLAQFLKLFGRDGFDVQPVAGCETCGPLRIRRIEQLERRAP
jgi:hypothetical protein